MPALDALLHAAATRIRRGVLTQPDRPAGRGRQLHGERRSSSARSSARLPVEQPADAARRRRTRRRLRRSSRRTLMVVVAYGLHPAAGRARRCRALRLREHPRLAAAALARRGADPARDPGRRRARPASPSCRWTPASTPGPMLLGARDADRAARERGERCTIASPRSAPRRSSRRSPGLQAGTLAAAAAARGTARPMPPSSTRARRSSTGRSPRRARPAGARVQPVAGGARRAGTARQLRIWDASAASPRQPSAPRRAR